MADEADLAGADTARENIIKSNAINTIRLRAAQIPAGEEGDCEECGQHFTRLVNGYCGRCRDYLKLLH
jgi:hypothetical protein